MPAPRKGWHQFENKRTSARGRRPRGGQMHMALRAAKELEQSTTYAADFGALAPDLAPIVYLLTNAVKWRQVWRAAQSFFEYATDQRATWESAALEQMDDFAVVFKLMASRNGRMKDHYPGTVSFLEAPSQVGKRAAATRAKKKRAAAKAGK